jgi:hypothetical protein
LGSAGRAAFSFFSPVSNEQISQFGSEQINEYVWRRMVMFNTANVASPNFGTKIYDHLSPWTASPSAAAAV